MNTRRKEWKYIDDQKQTWSPLYSLDELDELYKARKIDDSTQVANWHLTQLHGLRLNIVAYSAIARLNVSFEPTIEAFFESRKDKFTTILSGPNNSGKTTLLKQVYSLVGPKGYLIACNRFSHVDILNTRERGAAETIGWYTGFINDFQISRLNSENNVINLENVITGLPDSQRTKLFALCKSLLGNDLSLQRINPNNIFSPLYVDMDGQNLRYGSTGTRLLLTMLGVLLDERLSTILIDEPEMGLNPGIQATLARFLFNREDRRRFCPHVQCLVIATHSHLFLDKDILENNFIVTKSNAAIRTHPVQSNGDYYRLQFEMLGNQLESIFFPSAVLITEGDSDVTFLRKVMQLHITDRKIAVVRGGGDGGIQNRLEFLRQTFGDLRKCPYWDRIFVVFDKTTSLRQSQIEKMGVVKDNITMWSKNGIEYMYPPELVALAFSCDPMGLARINVESDPIEYQGNRFTKKELAKFVDEHINVGHKLPEELGRLVDRIRAVCK